jgi:hypothetical protein
MQIRIRDLVNAGSRMGDGKSRIRDPGYNSRIRNTVVILQNIPGDECCGQLQILHNSVARIPLRFLEYRHSTYDHKKQIVEVSVIPDINTGYR